MPYPRHPAVAGALLSALAIATALPPPTQAQIRRCTTPDGGTVYTDRSCASLGAVESRPMAAPGGLAGGPRYRGGCARSLQDLVSEVSTAIDTRDTDRLSRHYHWPGMGTRSGYAMIERLDAIAHRPLINITALRPEQPVIVSDQGPLALPGGGAVPAATPARPQRPVALRIDQVLGDGITATSTTFSLRRHMDCWWISL